MLTVKQTEGGQEIVMSCDYVHYQAAIKNEANDEPEKVDLYKNDSLIDSIESGTCYVMNEAGKTVATYRLPQM